VFDSALPGEGVNKEYLRGKGKYILDTIVSQVPSKSHLHSLIQAKPCPDKSFSKERHLLQD